MPAGAPRGREELTLTLLDDQLTLVSFRINQREDQESFFRLLAVLYTLVLDFLRFV